MAERPVRESVLHFGPDGALVGVLTRPDTPNGEPAVVLLNAGILHRVGPGRIHVRLARHLSEEGWTVLRFDLPGIGDSDTLRGAGSRSHEVLTAVRAAMDVLQDRRGVDDFVLMGICSGAADSFRASCEDPRVAGIVMIDPPTFFPTGRHRLERLRRLLLDPRRWRRVLGSRLPRIEPGRLRGVRRRKAPTVGQPQEARATDAPETPSSELREAAGQAFQALAKRGVQVLLLVTGDQRYSYSYRDQIFDAFPKLDLRRIVEVHLFPGADHTFTRERDRNTLSKRVREWLHRRVAHTDRNSRFLDPSP